MEKEIPIYESNGIQSEDNPTYIVSRQVGTIKDDTEEELKVEDIPRYVVQQEDTTAS